MAGHFPKKSGAVRVLALIHKGFDLESFHQGATEMWEIAKFAGINSENLRQVANTSKAPEISETYK